MPKKITGFGAVSPKHYCSFADSLTSTVMLTKTNLFFGIALSLIRFVTFAQNPTTVVYDTISHSPLATFYFPDTTDNVYLRQLREDNQLLQMINSYTADIEKVLLITKWTHQQWKHNGSNVPSKGDALTILKEAREGKRFRCVEYGTVLSSALMAVGYEARQVGLQTKDVETAQYGAGHVFAEVWLPDFKKWAVIDAQFNVMPMLDGVPLNSVELQDAITSKKAFQLIDTEGTVSNGRRRQYLSFIPQYLYFLTSRIDQRRVLVSERKLIDGKTDLMLVPLGAKNPEVFQRIFKINNAYYTHALKDFYPQPELAQ